MQTSPAFGTADLTNCERELIHLAGSVQPHGVLLVLRESDLCIVQASASVERLLGFTAESLLQQPVSRLGGDIERCVRRLASQGALADPEAMRCRVEPSGREREFEGSLHRIAGGWLVIEIEPIGDDTGIETVDLPSAQLLGLLGNAVQRISGASTIGIMSDAVVKSCREMFGYDRIMVYSFDPDGHGKIIAEARDPRLESLLGHHYPATDIPQRARDLYLRTRLRVLVDVHYEASPLVPQRIGEPPEDLDMSLCYLRSMSPLHLQYLKNMGVTATLVVSLVREGRLWGLIACHHYSPRNLRFAMRAAADLLAEVVSTRIAAIENYAHAQVAIQVRRLEQRLVEATSTEGDWRVALFRNPRTLLQPLDATGAALFHEGEVLTVGETPTTAELRELMRWIDGQQFDTLFSCSSVEHANPALDSLTASASGVVAAKLSASQPDYLMWFRKEQLLTVTWAGDPTKPVVDNDPLKLSPRRSFAAWSEIVRGTALPWSAAELALARAFGAALIDIVVQVNAVRLLIAEHQLAQIRATVSNSNESVVIADARGRVLFANPCFMQLARRDEGSGPLATDASQLFAEPERMRKILEAVAQDRQRWRGDVSLALAGGGVLPAALRAEPVPARDGSLLGFFLIFADLTDSQRAAQARRHLEQSLSQAVRDESAARTRQEGVNEPGDVIGAILSNASLAAMDIADGNMGATVVPLLEELEASTRRATALYSRVKAFSG
ncbi:GAF domain-containing protein [Variovorax sp. J22R133]|uniref:GAF domain-containing protein n=1 Tax=Variovorax brevis TaxID=3053503 RepID=UPI002575D8D9|nr:GAF domain-containing protein [Variovorax sp. J22R133]MDM0113802.1 GAF domain-containing protein [Variovorax sp. J22R133]